MQPDLSDELTPKISRIPVKLNPATREERPERPSEGSGLRINF